MSYIAMKGEASTSSEIEALTNLTDLATGSSTQAIRKTGPTTFENIDVEVDTNDKVRLDSSDPTPGYLDAKLQEGIQAVQFDILNTPLTNAEGLLQWNSTDGTLDLGMQAGTITQQIGQELFTKVRNDQGDQINNGQAVYISGRTGVFPDVKLARSDADATSIVLGVATEDILNTGDKFGYITTMGYVRGIKTDYTGDGDWGTTWITGDKLYLSKTVDGQLTNIEPDVPHHSDIVGQVGVISSNQGSILVNINKHKTLEELSDVNGGSFGNNGDLIVWNNDANYFTPSTAFSTSNHYTGFPDRTSTTLSWDDESFELTLTATDDIIWINGVSYTIDTLTKTLSVEQQAVSGLYWFWVVQSSGVPEIDCDNVAPGFDKCLLATVYWNATTQKGIISDERHWMGRDKWMHEYLHETIGARYASGMTGTFTDTTFQITDGEFYDEDIEHELGGNITTARVMYHNGDSDWAWDVLTTPYKVVDPGVNDNLRYNNGNALATVNNNKYVNYWVFVTADIDYPIQIFLGTAQYNTLALARAATPPSFGALGTAENKLIYKITYQNNGGTPDYKESTDYRTASNLPTGSYVATDHGTLTGLTDLDHPASAIINTPAGNIAATDVQAALNELDSEKAAATHATQHAVGATDTVFPADPGADKYLMWDDDPGQLVWNTVTMPSTTYDCVVAASGGDYTTVGDAIAANMTSIFVKDGTYAEGAITSATAYLNIVGESQNAIISMGANSLTLSGTNVKISNCCVALAAGKITLSGDYAMLTGCKITKSAAAGQVLVATGAHSKIIDNYFIDASTTTNNSHIQLGDNYIEFSRNTVTFEYCGTGADYSVLYADGNANYPIISNNHFQGVTRAVGATAICVGINLFGAIITGNYISFYSGAGIGLYLINGGAVVSGNRIITSATGIYCNGADRTTITGNQITSAASSGLYLNTSKNNSVIGNEISSSTNNSITFIGVTNTSVIGNRMTSGTTVLDANSNYNMLIGNIIDSSDLSDSGTGNLKLGNTNGTTDISTVAMDIDTLTINTGLIPDANDGAYLGTTALSFSDLFLASGGVINWANGNGTLTHSTGLLTSNIPLSLGTSNAFTCGTIELGHASDNTLSAASGVLSIESVAIPTISSTSTLTNKRITQRVTTTTDDATAVINIDTCDVYELSAVANATEFTTTGTPTDGQKLMVRLKDAGVAKALTWTGFTAIGVTLPTTTVAGKWHYIGCVYNSAATAWHAIAVGVQA